MNSSQFFEKQSPLTKAKAEIYHRYISEYLPKLIMTFEELTIVDLFCGPGRNGDEKGSPLILIETSQKILSSDIVKRKIGRKINIVFSDRNSEHIQELKESLKSLKLNEKEISVRLFNKSYLEIKSELIFNPIIKNKPTFFFLDPFTYSDISTKDLLELMSLSFTEILLFIPIFHLYRFNKAELNSDHGTVKVLDDFCGLDRKKCNTVLDFKSQIDRTLRKKLSLKYVRSILIDGGSQKNAVFLLTKHNKGMLLMNQIAFKMSNDGFAVPTKPEHAEQITIFNFSKEPSTQMPTFQEELINFIQDRERSNSEIVEFTIVNGYLPKHSKSIIKDQKLTKEISIIDADGNEIENSNKWNIAETIKVETFFRIKK